MDGESMEITRLLQEVEKGDRQAVDDLYDAVYQQLRNLAAHHRAAWHGDETLNTTALVHEAYLKLVNSEHDGWKSRQHFFGVASRAMRHLLVDKARRRLTQKRGEGQQAVSLEEDMVSDSDISEDTATELLAVHEALEQLEQSHPRQARVVECRFFGGLQVDETGQALGISINTVHRDWALARLWLHRRLWDGEPSQ
jgi:RNA polymerase sigma factor (TIGR02999 family)